MRTFTVSLLITALLGPAASAGPCGERVLEANYFRSNERGGIIFNNGARAQAYPLQDTLANLGITLEQLRSAPGPVLLLGEGFGFLYPELKTINYSKYGTLALDMQGSRQVHMARTTIRRK